MGIFSNSASKQRCKVVVGLGKTGLSCARYFASRQVAFKVVDSRDNPPELQALKAEMPQVEVEMGEFSDATFSQASELVVSPGISLVTPAIVNARKSGVNITGDIDIFSKVVMAPVVAVTGSNGKSTVVSLLADICGAAGLYYGLGGNLDGERAKPALDLLREPAKDIYILEVSSFQLETTESLQAEVAVILNLSDDHMDRYSSTDAYLRAKQRIFRGCKQVVVNRDNEFSVPPDDIRAIRWDYSTGAPENNSCGLVREGQREFIVIKGDKIMPVDELKVFGQHNISNVLAAITLARAIGVEIGPIRQAVKDFKGLPNRCQWVGNISGVDFYNDSKGTNVGATVAAVEGLAVKTKGAIILIAGGIGKGADFKPLANVIGERTKHVILIGRDANMIAKAIADSVPVQFAGDMQDAVRKSLDKAVAGDAVLLSPACASFDMFRDFQHRGQVFTETVRSLH
jgi:UDP-N-acetylmuramoylalanine--D-glutamate ligase